QQPFGSGLRLCRPCPSRHEEREGLESRSRWDPGGIGTRLGSVCANACLRRSRDPRTKSCRPDRVSGEYGAVDGGFGGKGGCDRTRALGGSPRGGGGQLTDPSSCPESPDECRGVHGRALGQSLSAHWSCPL